MRNATRHSTAGFTLFELLVVVVMASILALIAAPSWLTFVNNRRADAGRDQILQLLRQAQTQAMQTRQRQVVNFITPANALPIIQTGSISQTLDGQVQADKRTNKTYGLEVISRISSAGCAANAVNCLVFDDRGNVDIGTAASPTEEAGIMTIVVTSPVDGGSVRCVNVKTILGSMQNGIGRDECK
ncbi:MAG: prepilin-type N-terminal cleavage/methylation domain-containing protein [Pegethrix bostrychoides GSE-TBD4-15B]|jgi:prepilin-type N-terminal cleavage/methylation domain-containing protein|uniref:Prepilin-type N-terminal cleavage/methylation domain-containing protein n=1 Tax=Pegethrix bostrychoides GSE-TBD4-15B TaxID=2839662 RepID=A0A951U4W2_9CYAN|nr:prepilin-type N-terminal cleavage/methylation domain-containing protein [Pegethrix bostrychoides GSE-TBD4-15B]